MGNQNESGFHATNPVQAAPLSCQLPEIGLPMTPRRSMLLAGSAFPGQSPSGHIVNAQVWCNQMLLLVTCASYTAIQMQGINVKQGGSQFCRIFVDALRICLKWYHEVASLFSDRSLPMDIQRKILEIICKHWHHRMQ